MFPISHCFELHNLGESSIISQFHQTIKGYFVCWCVVIYRPNIFVPGSWVSQTSVKTEKSEKTSGKEL